MSTCATAWEQETDDVHRRFSLIEKEIRKESYVKYPTLSQTRNKDMPSVQADIFSKGQSMLDIDQSIGKNITGNKSVTFAEKFESTTKDQFKIVTGESYDDSNKSLTELTKTSSGTLAIALDEKVIELIDKKTSENPNILVTLKKTDSGQFTVNFNAEDSSTEDAYRVLVGKTSSGTRTLEVHDNFVKKLQAKDKVEVEVKEISPAVKKDNKTIPKTSACSKAVENNNSIWLNSKANGNEILDNELLRKYDSANKIVDVKVMGKNGLITEIQAPLTKTLSGNIAVDVQELALLGDIQGNVKERAVALTKSESGSYNLNISRDNKFPNAVIRKTPSGGVLVVLTDYVLKSMETAKMLQKEEFFQLKIKNTDCDVSDSPAVLKSTPSHNFILIIDKEYEKEYEKAVKDTVEDTECFINISRTISDNYVINFDDSDKCFKSNAILVKSPSGNIKVMKTNAAEKICNRQPSTDSGSNVFCEILKRLPPSVNSASRGINQATRLSSIKSSSDSNLYEKAKTITRSYEDILTKPLAALKKSSSGQYAVVMGKESKKAFVNNLKSYLQSNSQGLIPVRRSQSGEITIVLNDDQKDKTHYGSLKITPSGNIFVLVDESLVKEIENENIFLKKITTEQSVVDTRSTHMIGKLKRPVNKAVATTCNAKPDKDGCDPSKCICEELQCNAKKWNQDTSSENENGLRLFSPEMCGIDWGKVKRNRDGSCKICDPEKCTEKCNSTLPKREYIKPKDKLPHIVIKPCACKPVLQKNPRAEEQCFYYLEAVCPYHKNRYDSVSNDLLEISGLCKKISEKESFKNCKRIKRKPKNAPNDNNNWDSLRYLPPQLPGFLSEFKYR